MNKAPTAFEMERILAYALGARLATDMVQQRQDIDLVMPNGTTVSVKKQDAAARTGNISLEVEQIDTNTGATVPGNFTSCKAQCLIIVVPVGNAGQYDAHLWEHATLAKLAASYPRKHLTQERLEANRQRGNRYDDAVSVLIPLSVASKHGRVRRIDVARVQAEPAFQAFCRANPNTQREY